MCLYIHNFLLFIFLFITISAFQAITLWAIIGNFLHSLKKMHNASYRVREVYKLL